MKWYVFDESDYVNSYDTLPEAAAQAEFLDRNGINGIHIVKMTKEQFDMYTQTGEWPF